MPSHHATLLHLFGMKVQISLDVLAQGNVGLNFPPTFESKELSSHPTKPAES